MATLREFIDKFGPEILDAELSFRVYDGHLNAAYINASLDWGSMMMIKHPEQTYARFNVPLDHHRLVKERKK